MKKTLIQTTYVREGKGKRWNLDSQETLDYSTELFEKRILGTVRMFKDRGFTQKVGAWYVESITPDNTRKTVFKLVSQKKDFSEKINYSIDNI